MDATTQAFVTEIVSRKIAENWLYWLLYLAAVFVAAYLSAYIKKRAENLATKADFDDLKAQLRQTTTLTEEIKREIGHAEWKARESNALLRSKLEELLQHVATIDRELNEQLRKAVTGNDFSFDSTLLDRLDVLRKLYFPELRDAVDSYELAWREAIVWGFNAHENAKAAMSSVPYDKAAYNTTVDLARKEWAPTYKSLRALKHALEDAAAEHMSALLQVPPKESQSQ